MKKLSLKLFNLLPRNSITLAKISKTYLDRFNGDNQSYFLTNGEAQLLRCFAEKCARSSVTVFDIGANIGEWSLFAEKILPSAAIHLFEPSRKTFAKLSEVGWSQNVQLNNVGLGSKVEQKTLYIYSESDGMNSMYPRHGVDIGEPKEIEVIAIETVDQYCLSRRIQSIDFMKIDVEGHELDVLKGAEKMLQDGRISNIQFEYGGCNIDSRVLLRDLWSFLSQFGFRMYKIYESEIRFVEKYSQNLETFQHSNWLARSAASECCK